RASAEGGAPGAGERGGAQGAPVGGPAGAVAGGGAVGGGAVGGGAIGGGGALRPRGEGGQRDHDGGDLLLGRVALDDPDLLGAGHSGMFPCFFGGRLSRLVRSSRSERVISARVRCGLITAST